MSDWFKRPSEPGVLTEEMLRSAVDDLSRPRLPRYITHPQVYREVMADPTLTDEEKFRKILSHPSTSVEYHPLPAGQGQD